MKRASCAYVVYGIPEIVLVFQVGGRGLLHHPCLLTRDSASQKKESGKFGKAAFRSTFYRGAPSSAADELFISGLVMNPQFPVARSTLGGVQKKTSLIFIYLLGAVWVRQHPAERSTSTFFFLLHSSCCLLAGAPELWCARNTTPILRRREGEKEVLFFPLAGNRVPSNLGGGLNRGNLHIVFH